MLVGRRKDDEGTRIGERGGQRRAADFGHLDVEKQYVRPRVADHVERLHGAAGLADHFDVARRFKQLAHPHAGRRLVVHEHGANHAAP